jgi:hypothetical protein
MSNGHAPGIKFKSASFAGVTPEGLVSFQASDADVARVVEYFTKYAADSFDVSATVARASGSTGNMGEAPTSGG